MTTLGKEVSISRPCSTASVNPRYRSPNSPGLVVVPIGLLYDGLHLGFSKPSWTYVVDHRTSGKQTQNWNFCLSLSEHVAYHKIIAILFLGNHDKPLDLGVPHFLSSNKPPH